jgi:hypothetical protein
VFTATCSFSRAISPLPNSHYRDSSCDSSRYPAVRLLPLLISPYLVERRANDYLSSVTLHESAIFLNGAILIKLHGNCEGLKNHGAVGEEKREPDRDHFNPPRRSRDVFRKLKAPPNGGIINAKEQTNKRREKITSNGVPRSQTSPSLVAGILGCRDVGGATTVGRAGRGGPL